MVGRRLLHVDVLEKFGEGGTGVGYRARDTHLDRFVAIKVLPAEIVADPERRRRFVQEAKAASARGHSGDSGDVRWRTIRPGMWQECRGRETGNRREGCR